MRHVKILLQLHSIKLALISVCAISYLALNSAISFDNVAGGEAIAVSAVPSVNQETKSEGPTINENPRPRADLGALTTPTGQPLKFPLHRQRGISLDQAAQKTRVVINKFEF